MLFLQYVGESERAVRQVFSRAQASSPCIVFFDELDALVPRRDDNLSESSARVVNTLLTELDGLTPRKQVFVIGATNRPDMIDPAMVRPGRLDKLLYVDLPTQEERLEILRTLCRKVPLSESLNFSSVVEDQRSEGFSGADLGALVREAAVTALREALPKDDDQDEAASAESSPPQIVIEQRHFDTALKKVSPSVSQQQRRRYEALRNRFAGIPVGKKRSVADEEEGTESKVSSQQSETMITSERAEPSTKAP
jgi:ribosome biogenesis ATPase